MRDGVLHVIDATFLNNEAEKLGPRRGRRRDLPERRARGRRGRARRSSTTRARTPAPSAASTRTWTCTTALPGQRGAGVRGQQQRPAQVQRRRPTNGQYQVGSGGNAGAVGMDGGSDGTHTFCGNTFKGNTSGTGALGGAMGRTPDAAMQTTVIDRCLFDSNTGDSAGAACTSTTRRCTITASTFTGNVGLTGTGTIQADGTTFDFTNVTFYGNHAKAGVAATLALFGGGGTLLNCTFANNVCDAANMFGAAIFGSPNLTIQNTIFDKNTAQNAGRADAVPGGDHHRQRRSAVAGGPRERGQRRCAVRARDLRGRRSPGGHARESWRTCPRSARWAREVRRSVEERDVPRPTRGECREACRAARRGRPRGRSDRRHSWRESLHPNRLGQRALAFVVGHELLHPEGNRCCHV